jgi:hypothetical protein
VNLRVFSSIFVRFRAGGRTKSGQESAPLLNDARAPMRRYPKRPAGQSAR